MTDPRSPQEWELLFDRYLAGELSRAEETELLRGLAERGEDRWAVDALRACRDRATAATVRTIGELSVTDDPAADLEGVVRLERALRLSEAPIDPPATRPRALSFRHPGGTGRARDRWPRGAGGGTGLWALIPAVGARAVRPLAALAVAVVVALSAGPVVRHGARRTSPGRAYSTTAGQRLSVTLVDGTQFTLAPRSTVRVAADYGRGIVGREVELEGEAYFAVVHDAAHPFAVRTHGALARDVGTAFDVRAYPEDAGARIAVAEGVVAVGADGGCQHAAVSRRCVVEARTGDVATVADTALTIEHGVDVASLTAWTRGELVFHDTPLRDVIPELERWYGIAIRLADPRLAEREVQGTLRDESVTGALDLIVRAVDARYEQTGQLVTIYMATEQGRR